MDDLNERSELIFNYNNITGNSNSIIGDSNENDVIDLEIIFMGSKSKRSYSKHYRSKLLRRGNNYKSHESLTNSIDNDDPLSNKGKETLDKLERTNSNSESKRKPEEKDLPNETSKDDINQEESSRKEAKPKKSPEIDERLLERMERRYKTTGSNVRTTDDDGVYIDYMDYF